MTITQLLCDRLQWPEHNIVVTPEFRGIHAHVTGRNKNDIKEYLGDLYYDALMAEWTPNKAT